MMTEHIFEGTLVRLTRSSVDGGWPFYFFYPRSCSAPAFLILSSDKPVSCSLLSPPALESPDESPIMCELCKEHISFSQAVM